MSLGLNSMEETMKRTLFVKYNRTRKPEFQIRTRILEENGVRYVEKIALCREGESHIRSFAGKRERLAGINPRLKVLKAEFGTGEKAFPAPGFPSLRGRPWQRSWGNGFSPGSR